MRPSALFILALGLTLTASTAAAEEESWSAVLVFARGAADPQTAVRAERDLRNMFDYTAAEMAAGRVKSERVVPAVRSIERRYDVGRLRKGDLEKSRRHFNDAQRALEKGDAEEAEEQLFRAERFYNKAIPYASDTELLQGIYYYRYLVKAAGDASKAGVAYCEYVALARNLAGSAGPVEQFEPLADRCGETSSAGTGELKINTGVSGAHVYVDGQAVGVISKGSPYVNPFLTAGPHLVEVRKAGYARWGTLVNLKNGQSKSVSAKLKKARNRADEYEPLSEMIFRGPDAFSEEYRVDLMFQMAELFRVDVLVAGYLEQRGDKAWLTLFTFRDASVEKHSQPVPPGRDGHRKVLKKYWSKAFGQALEPADALPVPDRWAPTLFKVE